MTAFTPTAPITTRELELGWLAHEVAAARSALTFASQHGDPVAHRRATARWTEACVRLLSAVRTPVELAALSEGDVDASYGARFLQGSGCYDD